ncbi:MAG: acyltransferase [Acidimicrobiia bacterium]|nr:acyltransferase [Acidimicrobiia bacterium]
MPGLPPSFEPVTRGLGDAIQWAREAAARYGTIGPRHRRGRRFGRMGEGSAVCFPVAALFGEEYIHLGEKVVIGPYCSLSAGVAPGHVPLSDPVVVIGDRTVIGKGSGVVGHQSIRIGSDVWTGHHVYITDANHGYEDVTTPIGLQFSGPRPVTIGDGTWLGHGVVVLPGARVGRHVAVGAGSVVTGELPDFSVAVGNPARVIRRYDPRAGWQRVDADRPAGPDPTRGRAPDPADRPAAVPADAGAPPLGFLQPPAGDG